MQQYLFRGKRIDNGEWVEGDLLQWPNGEKEIVVYDGGTTASKYTVVPETVGLHLFTCDSNGKNVFDGDILNGRFQTGHGGKCIRKKMMNYAVKLHNKFPEFLIEMPKGYGDYRFCPHIEDSVLVGNIWDNPELLNPTSGQAGISDMTDPNLQTAEGQQAEETAALESATQDNAMEATDSEEGSTEG